MRFLMFILVFLLSQNCFSKGIYQTNSEYLNDVFNKAVPATKMLWLTGSVKKGAIKILGESPGQLRVRYWQNAQKTSWILQAIGKEKPITVGIVIDNNHISEIKVLAFRESRGWQVKEVFFLEQFNLTKLTPALQLDKTIDGISGATLSVRALKKLARLALFYHQQVMLNDKRLME